MIKSTIIKGVSMNIAVVDDCKSFADDFCTVINNYCVN